MSTTLSVINPHAAGIDIGADKVFVAVADQPVRSFETFTASLLQMQRYLLSHGITTVAMEATGIYWFAIYDILEQAHIKVCLVNSRQLKYVPGRKSDVQDCQWLQQLHSLGLLHSSFIPDATMRTLRSYTRLREDHIRSAAMHIQHMQKALDAMNLKLHNVISQLVGVSGLRIIRAILDGQRNAEAMAALCDRQILKTKRTEVIQSLQGNYKDEYLFALRQAVELWDIYQQKIKECDKQIESFLDSVTSSLPPQEHIGPRKAIRHHAPDITDLPDKLLRLTNGIDPTVLPALTDLSLLKALSEIGTDMSPWPTVKHFTSWLTLAPGKHASGKRSTSKHPRRKNEASQIFRQGAFAIGKSKHLALGSFYRRIRSKAGAKVANVATARKLGALYYNMMKYGLAYVETGLQRYEQQLRERTLKYVQKQARTLGFVLTPMTV
jgi:transposase